MPTDPDASEPCDMDLVTGTVTSDTFLLFPMAPMDGTDVDASPITEDAIDPELELPQIDFTLWPPFATLELEFGPF